MDHIFSEAIGEENIMDFHSKAFCLTAGHIHSNLQKNNNQTKSVEISEVLRSRP